jgi:adenine-specific DNA methylase
LVSDIEGGTRAEGVRQQGDEENIWKQEGWKNRRPEKIHNKELLKLYLSQSITRMVKLRKIRWAWHVTRMGEIVFL